MSTYGMKIFGTIISDEIDNDMIYATEGVESSGRPTVSLRVGSLSILIGYGTAARLSRELAILAEAHDHDEAEARERALYMAEFGVEMPEVADA